MNVRLWKGLFLVFATVALGVVALQHLPLIGDVHAGGEGGCPVEFADAEFFIEVNATDGDAGVQLMLDGVGWKELEIIDPLGSVILELSAPDGQGGSIGVQGLTELFFESAEPSFDVQMLQDLLDLFPEGDYEFEGLTTEGEQICGTAEFTHNIPAEPSPEVLSEDDDEVKILWDPVEDPFDDPYGAEVGDEIEIDMYRVIVEALDEEGEGLETLDVELPSTALCMTIPPEFLALSPSGEFKFEVIATEESGNQTIFEDEFALDDEDDEDDEDDDQGGDGNSRPGPHEFGNRLQGVQAR